MISVRKKVIFSIILIVFLTFISFSSSLDNGFTNWDDPDYVIENNKIRELSKRLIPLAKIQYQKALSIDPNFKETIEGLNNIKNSNFLAN